MKKVKIALLWHTFGHDNLGVDALARSSASLLRDAAKRANVAIEFVTLGSGQKYDAPQMPEDVRVGPGPRIKPLLTGRSEFLSVMKSVDAVVDIGEGDSWTDIYGGYRFAFHFGTKVAAVLLKKPLILAPQTIGPFNSPFRRNLARWVMDKATAVFARDDLSTSFLKDMKVRSRTAEFIDVAFRLPFDQQPKSTNKIRVGLNISGLLYNGGYTGKNELGMQLDYKAYTDRLIAALQSRPDVEVHCFAHVSGSGDNDDDGPVVDRLAAANKGVVAAPRFHSASEAKSYISGLDLVVAGRMHACIGAFSAGVPVVPVAYSRKFNGLFGTLGYPYFVDGKAMDTDKALALTLEWFDQRDVLQEKVALSLSEARVRLKAYEDWLVTWLAGLAKS